MWFPRLSAFTMAGSTGRRSQICHSTSAFLTIGLISAHICSSFVIRSYKDLQRIRAPYKTLHNEDSVPIDILDPKLIPLHTFRDRMRHLRSYRDVVRIFYGEYLPDRVVDEMLSARRVESILPYQEMVFDDSQTMDQLHAMKRAYEHWDEMTYSPITACAPKPQCVHIAEINKQADLMYYPSCTVIYKCSQTKCSCGRSEKCVPTGTELITRHFIVVRYDAMKDSVEPQSGPYVKSLTFENHTSCACSETRPLYRCPQCPYPFNLTRDAPYCECGCQYKNGACLNARKGRRPIPEDSLSCIKSGKCAAPSCEFGAFTQENLKRGYCPTLAEMEAARGQYNYDDYDYKDYQ